MSLILAPDDIHIGDFVTVLSMKQDPSQLHQSMGVPFQVKAICLPFVAAAVGQQKVTLDVRYLDLMKLTPEYVAAHQGTGVPNG